MICVGALNDDTNTKASYSNYGSGVAIWAPSNVGAITGGNTAAPVLTTFGETSASAPFIAGIAAMMKAINPALNSDQVATVLRDTAWTDSPDGNVSHYVNAFAAVQRASNRIMPHDRFESNETAATAETNQRRPERQPHAARRLGSRLLQADGRNPLQRHDHLHVLGPDRKAVCEFQQDRRLRRRDAVGQDHAAESTKLDVPGNSRPILDSGFERPRAALRPGHYQHRDAIGSRRFRGSYG